MRQDNEAKSTAQVTPNLFYLAYAVESKKLAQVARVLNKKEIAQLARQLDNSKLPAEVAEIPCFHNVVQVEKLTIIGDNWGRDNQGRTHITNH